MALNEVLALIAMASDNRRIGRMRQTVDDMNRENRGVKNCGTVDPVFFEKFDHVLAFSGGSNNEQVNCLKSLLTYNLEQGLYTVVLYPNALPWLKTEFGDSYVAVGNDVDAPYDPFANLSVRERVALLYKSIPDLSKTEYSYLTTVFTLVDGMQIPSLPELQKILLQKQYDGEISAEEASLLRIQLESGRGEEVRYFFSQIERNNYGKKGHPIDYYLSQGKIVGVEISMSEFLLPLVCAELEELAKSLNIIVIGNALAENSHLRQLYNIKNDYRYCYFLNDIATLKDEISFDNIMLFNHGAVSAQKLSNLIGTYHHQEMKVAPGGGLSVSKFGLSYTNNRNITLTDKDEKIIPTEAIRGLRPNQFIALTGDQILYGNMSNYRCPPKHLVKPKLKGLEVSTTSGKETIQPNLNKTVIIEPDKKVCEPIEQTVKRYCVFCHRVESMEKTDDGKEYICPRTKRRMR